MCVCVCVREGVSAAASGQKARSKPQAGADMAVSTLPKNDYQHWPLSNGTHLGWVAAFDICNIWHSSKGINLRLMKAKGRKQRTLRLRFRVRHASVRATWRDIQRHTHKHTRTHRHNDSPYMGAIRQRQMAPQCHKSGVYWAAIEHEVPETCCSPKLEIPLNYSLQAP